MCGRLLLTWTALNSVEYWFGEGKLRQDLTVLGWLELRLTAWSRLVINSQFSSFKVPLPGFEMFVTIYLLYYCLLTAVLSVEEAVGSKRQTPHSFITAPTVVSH